jgi:SNF2 family DNA or RNA helicase
MLAILEGNRIALKFNYSPSLVVQVKRLEGRTWNKSTRAWYIPLSSGGKVLPRLEALGFTIDPLIRQAVASEQDKAEAMRSLSQATEAKFETSLPLYGFQKATAKFMVEAKRCLNANFVGSGKTITTLAALDKLDCKRMLVVCPKSVIYQWKDEIGKWLPNWQVFVVDGALDARLATYKTVGRPFTSPVVVVVGYEIMRIDINHLTALSPDAVVCDEVHRLGSGRTQTHKAARQLTAPVVFGLSATPLMNRAADLWGIADIIAPGYLGSFTQFVDYYCIRNPWGGIDGTAKPEELAERFAPLMVRHKLEDVEIQLPELIEEDIKVELSATERSLYDRMRKELLFELQQEEVNKLSSPMVLQNVLVKMGKLQECTDSLALLGDKRESSKLDALEDHVADVVASGRKVICFTRFERMAQIIMARLDKYSPALITGQVDSQGREEAMSRLRDDSACQVLVSTDAGGVGLNLQTASVVYNFDLPFSVGRYHQRIGRAHRIGQTKSVLVYNLIARKTIDEHVKRILKGKQELSAALLDQEPWTGEEVMGLLEE